MKYIPHFFLGAPLFRKDKDAFESGLLERYDGNIDHALEYISKVSDRNITKGSGILGSTSILAGMSYFVQAKASLYLALFAVILMASMLYVSWPSEVKYAKSKKEEFHWTCQLAYSRSIINTVCAFLIILSVVFLFAKLIQS